MIPEILWKPDISDIKNAEITKYMAWLRIEKSLEFSDYEELWKWSVTEIEDFWESLYEYFRIISHSRYSTVLDTRKMPGGSWFSGATLNYSEHIFRNSTTEKPAIIHSAENRNIAEMSWKELEKQVASVASYLRTKGIKKGDTVVAFSANIVETTIAFLATNSIGAIWSSCSPDFGVDSVLERFQQIQPKILFAVNGYSYGGKEYNKESVVNQIIKQLSSLEDVVIIPFIDSEENILEEYTLWKDVISNENSVLEFTPVEFNDPIWVLYSSGTTGNPKAITHSHGGMLLEHLKYMTFHNDVRKGEVFYWYSTTGWMMWNFLHSALLVGATIVLYDGSAGYPNLDSLWKLSSQVGINHFGTSAPFIVACMKRGVIPKNYNLTNLRSIGSTGSPLPPEAFTYVKESIKENVWLSSMSGGTDVCTAFVGGNPLKPVYKGEIQCRTLGCALYAYNEEGQKVQDEVGEMVIVEPMPCMPIYFWNDDDMSRYKEAYFSEYPDIWRHGDWIKITPRNTLIIYGRSDATLNRHGVRIGTAEIYRSVNRIPEILDSLIVNIELNDGRHYMPLFVKMDRGFELSTIVKQQVKKELKETYSPRHVPDEIVEVPDIPYTISGKKMEAPVKKILMNLSVEKSVNRDAMKNPESIDFYIKFKENITYK